MRKKIIVWVTTASLALLSAGICEAAPACKTGSVKAEKGKLYHCEDDGNGPRWVKE